MNRQPDGQELSAAALRQLGAAFAAAGAPMNPGMMMAAWRALSSGDQARAQRGDPSVLGVLQRAAEDQIKLAQAAHPAKFPQDARVIEESPLGAKGSRFENETGRLSALWGQLRDRASNDGTSRTAALAAAGMSVPGNADARGFDIRNYYTSPVTRGLVDMGVTDKTYDHVRQHVPGVSTHNIRKAARDVKELGLNPNNERVLKNGATIHHKGDNPEETMRRMKIFQGDLLKSDKFRKAALEYDAAKTEAERKKIMDRINEIADKVAGKKGGVTEDQQRQRSDAVRKAIEEIKKDSVRQQVDQAIKQEQGVDVKCRAEKLATLVPTDDKFAEAIKAKLAASGTQPAIDSNSQGVSAAPKSAGASSQPTSISPKPAGSTLQAAPSTAKPGGTAP